MNSMIWHEMAWLRCFIGAAFGKSMIIMYYIGRILNANLYVYDNLAKMYVDEVMAVNVKEFNMYAEQFSDDMEASCGRSYHACIVLAAFNSCLFNDDHWYLEGERTFWIGQDSNRRQANVKFVEKMFLQSSPDWKRQGKTYSRKVQHIEKEDALFVE